MARIEWEVHGRRNLRLLANVSVTAEPSFRRMGFDVVRRRIKAGSGCQLVQSVADSHACRFR